MNSNRILIYFIILSVCACDDLIIPTDETQLQSREELELSNEHDVSGEDFREKTNELYYNLDKLVPGFGGVYLENEGTQLVVRVRKTEDTINSQDLVQIIRNHLAIEAPVVGVAVEDGINNMNIRIEEADFEYTQLKAWLEEIDPVVLSIQGVTFTSLSHAENRIKIGVEKEQDALQIYSALEEYSLPKESVKLTVTGPLQPDIYLVPSVEKTNEVLLSHNTLRDMVRPLPGGVENNLYNSNGNQLRGACTYGFNAISQGQRYWVTNSHCTRERGTVHSSDQYYQAKITDGTPGYIGFEVLDPKGFRCGIGRRCRYSDAALLKPPSELSWDFGKIARTQSPSWGNSSGSIIINDNSPRFEIVKKASSSRFNDDFIEGVPIHKVGRTTGWTAGYITNTCTTIVISSNFRLYCQVLADYYSGGGDSGSPVFLRNNDTDVTLYGIHWGRLLDGNQERIFSRITGIDDDFFTFSYQYLIVH